MTHDQLRLFIMDVTPLEDAALFARCLALLSFWRRQKVLTLRRPENQRLSLGAGLVLRHGFAALGTSEQAAGLAPDVHGKPVCRLAPQLQCNLSHSGTLVVGAFAVGGPVGVDIEHISPVDAPALSKRFFHPREHARLLHEPDDAQRTHFFYRIWTRKESSLKALGCGLTVNPASFSVLPEYGNTVQLGGQRWHLREYPAGDAYALAVCAANPNFPDATTTLYPCP